MADRPAVSRTVRLRSGRWTIGTVLSSTEASGFLVCSLGTRRCCLEGGGAVYAGRGVGRHCQGLHGSLMGQFARRGFEPAKVEFGLALRLSHALGSQATLQDSFSFRKTSPESGSGALCAPTVGRKGHDRRPISGQPSPNRMVRRGVAPPEGCAFHLSAGYRVFDRDVISHIWGVRSPLTSSLQHRTSAKPSTRLQRSTSTYP